MKSMVIAEHTHQQLSSSTLAALSAATQISSDITLLVAGHQCSTVAEQAATIKPIAKVVYIDSPAFKHFLAENMANLITSIANTFTHILAPATTFGKNILPRVAGILDMAMISEIIAIENHDTFIRPIYAGNALATIKSHDRIKILSVRTTAFTPLLEKQPAAPIEILPLTLTPFSGSTFLDYQATRSIRPELSAARVVISGGRGLQNADNFKLLEKLADCLHAAIGASRAAVDAGYISNDFQVGQTGKVVAPELYIAIGISGAIQHVAGMKDSKIIVAINKDPDAPIFHIADYGLVADLFTAVPELIELLKTKD